jgi:hypothetical protein
LAFSSRAFSLGKKKGAKKVVKTAIGATGPWGLGIKKNGKM